MMSKEESEGSWTSLSPATLTFMLDRCAAADPDAMQRTMREPQSPETQNGPRLGLVEEHQSPVGLDDLTPTTLSFLVDSSAATDQMCGVARQSQLTMDLELRLVEDHQPPTVLEDPPPTHSSL